MGRTLLDDWRSMVTVAGMADLSRSAKVVYLLLLEHRNRVSGQCNPSYPTLARGAAITRRGAMDAVAELESKGLLSVVRGGGDPGAARGYVSNSYVLTPPEGGEEIDTAPREEIRTGGSEKRSTGGSVKMRTPPRVNIDTPRGAKNRTQTIEREPAKENRRKGNEEIDLSVDVEGTPSTGNQSTADADFEAFWKVYPRRISKGSARKAWGAASNKANARAIVEGAQRYAGATSATEPRFIKHPATWLNAEGWLDEPEAGSGRIIDLEGNPISSSRAHSDGRRLSSADDLSDIIGAVHLVEAPF